MSYMYSGKQFLQGCCFSALVPFPTLLTTRSQILTADDVIANPVLVRKIQRVQAAENAQIQDDSDDDDVRAPASHRHRTDEISSSPARTGTPYVKNERRSQAPRNMSREVSMVPNTQIQGLVEEEQGRPSSSAVTDIVDLETEDEDADE